MKEEDYISDYYDNYYLHCPECMYQSLFGINYKQNIPFIQYRCRIMNIKEKYLYLNFIVKFIIIQFIN